MHNSNAKQLLDKIISMNNKDIQSSLDLVFNELNKSHELDNEFGETYYFYGVAFYKKGDYYIAINDFNKAMDAYNDSLYNFDKSESFYSHISNTYFDKGKTYIALGDVYLKRDSEKSKDCYQKAIDCFKSSLIAKYGFPENVYFAIGNIYYKLEDYQSAIENYSSALETANDKNKPTRKEIFFCRSETYFMLGTKNFINKDFDIALNYFIKSTEDNNENYNSHFEIAKTYCSLERWQEAVKKFDFILEHAPSDFNLEFVRINRNFAYSMIK